MNQASSWRAAMVAMRNAYIRRSFEALETVVKALGEDVPVLEMSVDTESRRVPLYLYLTTVMTVTEADHFFTGAPLFDIWTHLPYGLTTQYRSLDLSHNTAQKLLKRFNAYTWNEHKPKLRIQYMNALRKTLFTAKKEIGGWSLLYHGTPHLSRALDELIQFPEIARLRSVPDLRQINEEVKNIEKKIEEVPTERLRDIFTPKGWERMAKRERMTRELEPVVKEAAQNAIEALTEIGGEYRCAHVGRYYPRLI
mgnify:CR=1 FL=1